MSKVYEFAYSECIYESSHACISLHKTREGAEKALEQHKADKLKEWNKIYKDKDDMPYKFGDSESWQIYEREVLE